MMTIRHGLVRAVLPLALGLGCSGCGGGDTQVNSDPGPGRPSRADSGEKTIRLDSDEAKPTSGRTDPATGTDSTGRPSGASGGTTGATAEATTSATAPRPEDAPARK